MSFPVLRRAPLCAGAALTLLVMLLIAAQASAGTYQVHACDSSSVNRSWSAYGDTALSHHY